DGGIGGEAELRRDCAFVHVRVPRERRLLAVQRERSPGHRRVLERAAHQPGRRDRDPVVRERDRAGVCELAHLGQLLAELPARDRRHEADRYVALGERGVAAESTTGSVFGIATIAQYPPAAAASVPLAIVSSSSRPGVRRCTWG